jgi:hypothetical protein
MIKNIKHNIFLKKISDFSKSMVYFGGSCYVFFFLRCNPFKAHTIPSKGKKYMFFIEKKPSHLPSKHTLKNWLEMQYNPCFQEILFLLKNIFFNVFRLFDVLILKIIFKK